MSDQVPLEECSAKIDLFERPECLIETDSEGKLQVNINVVDELQKLNDQWNLVVIGIAGLYRTGKSYMMNRLAGKTAGEPFHYLAFKFYL